MAKKKTELLQAAEPLRSTGAVVDVVVLEGDSPAETFLSYLKAENPTVTVLAAGAKTPLDRWAYGSLTERIAQHSPVPTLIVGDPARLRDWDWIGQRLRILAAVDLTSGADPVLRWVKELNRVAPFDLIPCHLNREPVAPGDLILSERPRENPAGLQSQLERDLKKKVRDQLGEELIEVIVKPCSGEKAAAIAAIARETRADIIVVGTHQRHGLSRVFQGSISRELLHVPGLNIVCVPTQATFDPREAHIPDFRRVLVATDVSPLGDAAIPFACAACAIGGLVRIIHVVKPGRNEAPVDESFDGWQKLRGLIPAETGARCQPPEVAVLQDRRPAKAICEEADRFGADLVCLASHGLGASRALHGSVAKAVLRAIRRPVLVIRRPED